MSLHTISDFSHDEDGAVTVDWVVLCAALVALAILATSLVSSSAMTSVNATAGAMDAPTPD